MTVNIFVESGCSLDLKDTLCKSEESLKNKYGSKR